MQNKPTPWADDADLPIEAVRVLLTNDEIVNRHFVSVCGRGVGNNRVEFSLLGS